jgi:4-amino-4-deoxy-L-arabinose transferase-like glycosyltransferase
VLLVAAVTAALALPFIGQRPIDTTDEARFALYAQGALERGALFDVRVRGKLFREKPPLYAWSIAALSLPRGRVTEATAHAPVALAAVGAAAMTVLLGERLFGLRAGLWAGLILATSVGFVRYSQVGLPDMLVCLFATVAAYWLWRALSERAGARSLIFFHAALALAVYAKGPIGLLPLLVGLAWLWSQDGVRAVARLWSPAGALIFAAITATWLVPFLTLGTDTFAETVLWDDWLSWYASAPGRAALRALTDVLKFFLPWILVLPLALVRAERERSAPGVRYALLSFVVPLAVVLASANYRTRYLLPAAPGFALLIAWWADRHGTERTRPGLVIGWACLVAAVPATAALIAGLRWNLMPRGFDLRGLGPVLLPLALAGWAMALSLWMGLRARRPAWLVLGTTAAMVALLGCGTWRELARSRTEPDVRQLTARLEHHAGGGEVGVLFETGWLEVDFYLGRPVRQIEAELELERFLAREGGTVLASEPVWHEIQRLVWPPVTPIERLSIGGKTFVILRWRDPAR